VEALAVHDDGTGAALYIGGIFNMAGGSIPAQGLARWGCDGTISVTPRQDPTGVVLENANLVSGREYYNLLSLRPCAVTGAGPFLGLCASGPLALSFLVAQIGAPLGGPTHFVAPSDYVSWPAFLLPLTDAGAFDVVCVDVTGGVIGALSKVVRFVLGS
jgi:hypothetical protein